MQILQMGRFAALFLCALQTTAAADAAASATTNLATVRRWATALERMQHCGVGNDADQQNLTATFMHFFAPMLKCSSTGGEGIGFVDEEPQQRQHCFEQFFHRYRGTLTKDFAFLNYAVDVDSEGNFNGKVFILRAEHKISSVSQDGTELPGTVKHGVMVWMLEFNEQGKIETYHQFPDTMLLNQAKIQSTTVARDRSVTRGVSLASLGAFGTVAVQMPADAASATATNLATNLATLRLFAAAAKRMQNTAAANVDDQVKMVVHFQDYFAHMVQCSSTGGEGIGFKDPQPIPVATCFDEFFSRYGATLISNLDFLNYAVDVKNGVDSAGKVFMLRITNDVSSVNVDGSELPGTRVQATIIWMVEFNDQGKIATFREFPDTMLINQAKLTSNALARGNLVYMPPNTWHPHTMLSLGSPLMLAAVVCGVVAVAALSFVVGRFWGHAHHHPGAAEPMLG